MKRQMHQTLEKTIECLMKKDVPFVVYKHPESGNVCTVVQTEKVHLIFDIKEICQWEGFMIAPFEVAKSETGYFIRPDLFACKPEDYRLLLEKLAQLPDAPLEYDELGNYEMTKQEYLEKAAFLIDKLKKKELDKIVFSRVISSDLPAGFKVSRFYLGLLEKYPAAFVFLFNIPESGMWIGATPEILISQKPDEEVVIMSLAGTAPQNGNASVRWGKKEKEEQAYVSQYIRLKLSELGISQFEETPVKSVQAGPVAHLQTVFTVPAKAIRDKIGELVKLLHPTPAVCGLPKYDAYALIEKAEPHDRKYYTGFLGPWGLNGKKDLFVTLRCAEIKKNMLLLYVGGGFTAASDPEKEWQETEMKAKTLLSAL